MCMGGYVYQMMPVVWVLTCMHICKLAADWAEKLTQMGRGKHHLGDFLPPEELEKFMETYNVSCLVLRSCSQSCAGMRRSCSFLLVTIF